ncbi:hypothetical protein CHUAL_009280 [Chamberlinius hualienensis]
MGRGRIKKRDRGGKVHTKLNDHEGLSSFSKESNDDSRRKPNFETFIKGKYKLLNGGRGRGLGKGRSAGRGRGIRRGRGTGGGRNKASGRGIGRRRNHSPSRCYSRSPGRTSPSPFSRRSRSRSFNRRSRSRSFGRRSRSRSFGRRSRSRSFGRRSRSRSFSRRSRSPSFSRRLNSPAFSRRSKSPAFSRRSKSPAFSRRSRSHSFERSRNLSFGRTSTSRSFKRSRSRSFDRRSRSRSPKRRSGSRSPIRHRRSGSRISSECYRFGSFSRRSCSRSMSPVADNRAMSPASGMKMKHGCSSPIKENFRITIDNEHFLSGLKSDDGLTDAEETTKYWRRDTKRNQSDSHCGPNAKLSLYCESRGDGQFQDDSNPSRLSYKGSNVKTSSSNDAVSDTLQLFSVLSSLAQPMSDSNFGVNQLFAGQSHTFDNRTCMETAQRNIASSFYNQFESKLSNEIEFKPKVETKPSCSTALTIPGLDLRTSTSEDVDQYLYEGKVYPANFNSQVSNVNSENSSDHLSTNEFEASLRHYGIELKKSNSIMHLSEETLKRGEEVTRHVNDLMTTSLPLDPRLRRRKSSLDSARSTPPISMTSTLPSSCREVSNLELQTSFHCKPSSPVNLSDMATADIHDMPLPSFGHKRDSDLRRNASSNIVPVANSNNEAVFLSGKNKLNRGNLKVIALVDEQKIQEVVSQVASTLEASSDADSTVANKSQSISKGESKEHLLLNSLQKKMQELNKRLQSLKSKEVVLIRKSKRRKDGQMDPELIDNNVAQQKVQQIIENTKRTLNSVKKQMTTYGKSVTKGTTATATNISPGTEYHLNQVISSPVQSDDAGTINIKSKIKIHYRYVDYGTHWCKHCKKIFPHVQDFLKHLHLNHMNVIGVSSLSFKLVGFFFYCMRVSWYSRQFSNIVVAISVLSEAIYIVNN